MGFEAGGSGAQATAVALALDPVTLDVRSRLVLPSPTAGRSSALESIVIDDDGIVALGGAWDFPREALEGFKSYGNVVGGRGLVTEFPLTAWLELSTDGVDVTLEELGATTRDIEETFSVKSLRRWSDGRLVAVASDADEQSGVLWIDAGLTAHQFTTFDDGIELTDVVPFARAGLPDAAALVGHGGEGTIDGHVRLVTPSGETLWTRSFGNPGLDPSEVPDGGLAPDAFIFDECWGVDQRGAARVLACGSGIEGGGALEAGAAARPRARAILDEAGAAPRRGRRGWSGGLEPRRVLCGEHRRGLGERGGVRRGTRMETSTPSSTRSLASVSPATATDVARELTHFAEPSPAPAAWEGGSCAVGASAGATHRCFGLGKSLALLPCWRMRGGRRRRQHLRDR